MAPRSNKHQKVIRDLLPMLQVLKAIKPDDRVILLNHFNDEAKDNIYKTITHVLNSDGVSRSRKRLLRNKLAPYKKTLNYFISPRSTPQGRRRRVVQLGGNPLSYVLSTALPMFVNLFAQ